MSTEVGFEGKLFPAGVARIAPACMEFEVNIERAQVVEGLLTIRTLVSTTVCLA